MLAGEGLANFSNDSPASTAKKRYTAPALKIYGAVSKLTNGAGGSVADVGGGKHTNLP